MRTTRGGLRNRFARASARAPQINRCCRGDFHPFYYSPQFLLLSISRGCSERKQEANATGKIAFTRGINFACFSFLNCFEKETRERLNKSHLLNLINILVKLVRGVNKNCD